MNDIEEKIWSYVDGTCTESEKLAIGQLIEQDEVYRRKYQEILAFNQELMAMELDEPSMPFTYNVMEAIRTEEAQKPLKSAIDLRIIRAISGFFILTIAILLIYALTSVNWSVSSSSTQLPVHIQMPVFKNYLSSPAIKGFLFFDIVLALFLLDGYLRKRNLYKNA